MSSIVKVPVERVLPLLTIAANHYFGEHSSTAPRMLWDIIKNDLQKFSENELTNFAVEVRRLINHYVTNVGYSCIIDKAGFVTSEDAYSVACRNLRKLRRVCFSIDLLRGIITWERHDSSYKDFIPQVWLREWVLLANSINRQYSLRTKQGKVQAVSVMDYVVYEDEGSGFEEHFYEANDWNKEINKEDIEIFRKNFGV
jgi:hypothetical protein